MGFNEPPPLSTANNAYEFYAGETVARVHLGDIRNVTVYPQVFRGNHPDALREAYDVYYRISIVDKIATMLNIATAGKTIGRLVTEIAYA